MAGGGSRREARERALALLYEAEAKGVRPDEVVAALPVAPDPYAEALATGAGAHQPETDEVISRFARGWKLERMPAVDRALLRLAGYELRCEPDVPTGVVISEAVELASQYSTDDSGRFVNGLLARMAQELRGERGGQGPRPLAPIPLPLPVPTLGNGRVLLRPWEPRDAADLARAWADPEIACWSPVPLDRSEVAARRWIASTPALRGRGLSLDLVVSSPAGAVLGEVGFSGFTEDGAEIGFWIGAPHRGRGLATDAVRLATSWALRRLGLNSVVANADPRHVASRRVLHRAGYGSNSGYTQLCVAA